MHAHTGVQNLRNERDMKHGPWGTASPFVLWTFSPLSSLSSGLVAIPLGLLPPAVPTYTS